MKKTQWLVLLGDIRSSLVSFISIVMFVALGSGLFLGLKWNTASVSLTADSYYNEHLFHDFSAAFPYGITEEDVDAIRALDIVSDAEGGYTATGCSVLDGRQYVLALLSFTQRLDIAVVEEGVLPADYDFEAHKQLVPMQPGDVPVTYADTSALERDFGYKPATPLEDGLREFAKWYREFYGN